MWVNFQLHEKQTNYWRINVQNNKGRNCNTNFDRQAAPAGVRLFKFGETESGRRRGGGARGEEGPLSRVNILGSEHF